MGVGWVMVIGGKEGTFSSNSALCCWFRLKEREGRKEGRKAKEGIKVQKGRKVKERKRSKEGRRKKDRR
jgi:hypothetical protein